MVVDLLVTKVIAKLNNCLFREGAQSGTVVQEEKLGCLGGGYLPRGKGGFKDLVIGSS
jgi:hypothetical protein